MLLAGTVLLCGCAGIPDKSLVQPVTRPADLGKSVADAGADSAFQSGDWPGGEWWHSFGDGQLNRLVDEALARSPSMDVAAARLRQAQAAVDLARSATRPVVDANASVTRQHFSQHDLVPPEFEGTTTSLGRVALDFSYDFDLWGRNRHSLQARLGEARAVQAEQAVAGLLLSTAVAQAYFRLQGDEARLALARKALAWRGEQIGLAQSRFGNGLASGDVVRQAEAEHEQTRQRLVELTHLIQLDKTALASLAGQGPDAATEIAASAAPREQAFPLPQDLAVDLLGRRPDVMAMRWQVEAAAQEVGVARARFYPDLNLVAVAGLQSVELARLLTGGSVMGSVGPALHLPLFDGGARDAALKDRYAEYDIAVARYNQAVLDASREVVDRLRDLQANRQRRVSQKKVLDARNEAYQLADSRFRHGLTDYGSVLRAGQDVLEQRGVAIDLDEARLEATVGLVRALGGGYRASSPK